MGYTNKEKKNAYMRAWKKRNRKKLNKWNKAYKLKDPEKWKQYAKEWNSKNRERRNALARRVKLICEKCRQYYKGFRKTQRFCSRKCMGKAWSIPYPQSKGYRRKWISCIQRKIPEHRYIMEQYLGRKLSNKEVVHHIDHNRKNNSIENLVLFPSNSAHIKFHCEKRKKNKTDHR